MSCYESEEGTIKIPAKAWAKFRTAVIKAWNDHQLKRFERATKLHEQVTAKAKGKRGKARKAAIREFYNLTLHYNPEDIDAVEAVMSDSEIKAKPKKKDYKILPTSKDASIYLSDASIHLNNGTKSVVWVVPENNHARDYAHKHPVARKLFNLLDGITWTRGSGGQIVGNDEYNEDAGRGEVGGGGNYVTREYGPNVQRPRPR